MDNKPRIIFFDAKDYDQKYFNAINSGFNFPIKFIKNHLTLDTVSLAKGYNTVCAFVNDDLSAEIAKSLLENNVQLVALRCAGYNNVDLKAFYQKIHIVRVPSYSPNAVAEHTLALIFTLNRKTHRAYFRTRDNNFAINGLMGFDLVNKTVGIVGTGNIGKIVAKSLRAVGMNILAYDLFPDMEWATVNNIIYTDMNKLFSLSDIISLHCPLTPDTIHLINGTGLSKMKDGVMIINTGRGGLIDTADLLSALKSKKVGYAGLDVYEEEDKYFFEDLSEKGVDDDMLSRLLSFPNVLITSHQGFFTHEAISSIAETTLMNIKKHFEHKPLENEICYQCGGKSNCQHKVNGRCF